MSALLPNIDPEGLLEYSVVFTDRSLNHMSAQFQRVMNDVSATLKKVYNAKAVALIPGGGTYAMEAVARQLAQNEQCLVIRNGFFSFRWSQIIEMGGITPNVTVLKARQANAGSQQPFAPAPIDEVVAKIAEIKPAVVFAPHVETASGMILPDSYLKAVADAVHPDRGFHRLHRISPLLHDFRAFLWCRWVNVASCSLRLNGATPVLEIEDAPCPVEKHVTYRLTMLNFRNGADGTKVTA